MLQFSVTESNRKDVLSVCLIVVAAALVRIFYIRDYILTSIYPVLTTSDGYAYFLWAKDILSGVLLGSRAFMKWPFYAYFLALLFRIFGQNIGLIYHLQSLLGILNCVLVYLIARAVFSRRAGLIAALLCACYGLFIFYDYLLIYVTLSLSLNLLFLFWLLRLAPNPKNKNLFFLGLFLGLGAITQANMLIGGVLALGWALYVKGLRGRRFVLGAASFLIGLSCLIGAITLLNYLAEKDSVLLSGNIGINFYMGNNPQAPGTYYCPSNITSNQEDMFRDARIIAQAQSKRQLKTSEVSAFWLRKSTDFIRRQPRDYLKLMLRKIGYVFGPAEFVHDLEYYFIRDKIAVLKVALRDLRFIFVFILLGLFWGLVSFRKAGPLYILLIISGLSISVFFAAARYRIGIVPYLLIFAGLGISTAWEAFAKRDYRRIILFLVTLGLFIGISFLGRGHALRQQDSPRARQEILEKYLETATIEENNKDYSRALQALDLAYRLKPDDPRVIFRIGVINYYLNDFTLAERMFKRVLELNPYSVDACYNLGLIYNTQGRFSEAREVLARAVALNPDSSQAHFELALALKAKGELRQARIEFEAARKNTPRWRRIDRETIETELERLGP
jgi:Tfp pilus assembly protein PilF